MYDAQKIAKRIKERSRQQGIKLGDLLASLGMGINTVSHMAKGQEISYLAFAQIADALSALLTTCLAARTTPFFISWIRRRRLCNARARA